MALVITGHVMHNFCSSKAHITLNLCSSNAHVTLNFRSSNAHATLNFRSINAHVPVKALEERVHLGTRSERVPQTEERERNAVTFSRRNGTGTERSKVKGTEKERFLFCKFSHKIIIELH